MAQENFIKNHQPSGLPFSTPVVLKNIQVGPTQTNWICITGTKIKGS